MAHTAASRTRSSPSLQQRRSRSARQSQTEARGSTHTTVRLLHHAAHPIPHRHYTTAALPHLSCCTSVCGHPDCMTAALCSAVLLAMLTTTYIACCLSCRRRRRR